MIISKRSKALLILFAMAALAATPVVAQVEVGEKFPVHIDSAIDYRGSDDGAAVLAWQHEIFQPGATYIAVHFSGFRLAPGDELVVTDGNGGQRYALTDRGRMGAGTFWARHVKGDTARLELWATSTRGAQGFTIDEIAVGNEDFPGNFGPEAICGLDDKDNAVCYASTYPVEYDRSRAVARLLINGSSLCTGWLVTADNKLLTNEHCITSASAALNTDYEFMAEAPNCSDNNCQLCFTGDIKAGGTLLRDNAGLDYALVQVNGNPSATYGHLQIDNRTATVGEQIYIPQYPGGRAKELGIFSTAGSDAGDDFCHVNSISQAPCSGSGYSDVGYYCDTEGGSSGAPVLATSSHKVIALHHCANCPNRGVPITLVHADVADLLGPECTTSADCDDGVFCNGAEVCDGNSLCVSGADPCPGQGCDEASDTCVPLVCNDDGVCDPGEDCNNCSNDCIGGTSGAVCGDDVCEIGAGEDCITCPADCNGLTTGKPSGRFCCGDGIDCADSRCASSGNTCDASSGASYCCGDSTCEGDENSVNCEVDCGPAPICGNSLCESDKGEDSCSCEADCGPVPSSEVGLCTNGSDDDCDGPIDCADGDCSGDPACGGVCDPVGETCTTNADCCTDKCRGPSGRKTCK